MKKLIWCSLITLSLHASTEQKMDHLLKELSSVLGSSQLVCDENYASATLNERACEDLHQAACLDDKGASRYAGKEESMMEDLEKKLKAKRDEIAKSMFGATLEDAVKKELAKAGLPVVDDVDDYFFGRFLSRPYEYDEVEEFLKPAVECKKKYNADEARNLSYAQKKETLKKLADQVKKDSQSNRNVTHSYIEEIINTKVADCFVEKDDPFCKNKASIKREALLLARQKESADYPQKYQAFYDKYLAVKDLSLPDDEASIDESLSKVIDSGTQQCEFSSAVHVAKARNVVSETIGQIQYSKPFIEFMLDEFYSEEKRQQAQKLFDFARENMLSNLKNYVKDPEKYKKIEASYGELRLHWLNKPGKDEYEKKGSTLVYRGDNQLSMADNVLSNVLSDVSLNYFLDFNANYMPTEAYGDTKSITRVDMQPAMLKLLETNSMAFLEILGHEVAHKVGPEISRWNGFDLNDEHQKILSCYASSDSIGMQPNQADETLSDYFSAQILSKYIETLPAEKRLDAVIQSVEGYCIFESEFMPDHDHVHPDAYLRISGIIGAHPKIRELMGCSGSSTKFRTCGSK